MNTPTRPILTALGLAAVGVAAYATPAHAANCGGQSAAPQPVPYTCTLPGIDITVSGITRHFSAVVTANGTSVSVTYTMSAPLPVKVPILIVHHVGFSGAGTGGIDAGGFIPAGATTATVTDSAPCLAGQLDVKAVDISSGSGDKFRVGGPWIENGTGCIDTQTTVPATTVAPVTTVPRPPNSLIPPTNLESTTTVAGRIVTGAIPATGMNTATSIVVALTVLAVGGSVLWVTRRKPAQ